MKNVNLNIIEILYNNNKLWKTRCKKFKGLIYCFIESLCIKYVFNLDNNHNDYITTYFMKLSLHNWKSF